MSRTRRSPASRPAGAPHRRSASDRAYGAVAAQLGPDRVESLLLGAYEVAELAVRFDARNAGLGRRLSASLVEPVSDGRAWFLTARSVTEPVGFYRRVDWRAVAALPGSNESLVVFLAPDHQGDERI